MTSESPDLYFLSEMYSRVMNPHLFMDLKDLTEEEIAALQADILYTLTRELNRKPNELLDKLIGGQ